MAVEMDIEALLAWAYTRELPKARPPRSGPAPMRGGWDPVESYAALLAVVDVNAYGVVPDLAAEGEPHPDALAVVEAVREASSRGADERFEIDWSGFDPFADADAETAADARAMLDPATERGFAAIVERLVARTALLGTPPAWQGVPLRRRLVIDPMSGRPAWFVKRRMPVRFDEDGNALAFADVEQRVGDGHVRATRVRGAYRRHEVVPDPRPLARARADYVVWRAALDVIAILLEDRLVAHRVRMSRRPWFPWIEGEGTGPRVLPDLASPPLVLWERAHGASVYRCSLRMTPREGAARESPAHAS